MVLFPNAKINLGLKIIEKRPDGFHNLQTIFLPFGLCDVLEFVEAPEGITTLEITGIDIVEEPEKNLVYRAWQLMHDRYAVPEIKIHLHKIIPIGAGLGGGSADATFMITGLNRYFDCKASVPELELLASQLGSDCAFFVNNTIAYGTGRGEILEPIQLDLRGYRLVLINPGIHVPTRDAFAGVIPMLPQSNLKKLIQEPLDCWQQLIVNDFELSVFEKYPVIASIKQELMGRGALYTAMSGSGSSVYGIFNDTGKELLFDNYKKYFIWQGQLG